MSLGRIEASPHRNEVLRVESESLHRMTFARWPPSVPSDPKLRIVNLIEYYYVNRKWDGVVWRTTAA